MLLYFRYKALLKDKFLFSRWTELGGNKYLVVWDFYNKSITIKDRNFDIIQDLPLRFKYFKPKDNVKIILYRILENEIA